jgi:hypothetical protein
VFKLSDAFVHKTDDPELELKVTVYNINEGYNPEIMRDSKILSGYMYFVDTVRNNAERMELADAIETAIDDCISKGILTEFFKTRRNEVMKVMTMDYTWERREEIIRREEREEGREEGRKEGMIIAYISLGLSAEEIAAKLGMEKEDVEKIINEN